MHLPLTQTNPLLKFERSTVRDEPQIRPGPDLDLPLRGHVFPATPVFEHSYDFYVLRLLTLKG